MIDSVKDFKASQIFEKDSKIYKKIDRPPLSKILIVDQSIQFYLLHEYLRYLFENINQEMNAKIRKIEVFASILGHNIMERISDDYLGKFNDKIEIIKFLCKEFWIYTFGKMVDKLQTDSKGRYVIIDNDFRFLRRINSNNDSTTKEYIAFCGKFITFLIKSALLTFQFDTEITIETPNYIEYSFNILCKRK